jgi:hypothetical protein
MSVNIFEANANELNKLADRVREGAKRRGESAQQLEAWRKAARIFHESYDRLAFPGGLAKEFELLRAGDPVAIEMAVRFLEANPWFFRSGYHKEKTLSLLRRCELTDDQCARLRMVILDRVQGRPVREMRAYGRIARKVTTPEFEAELRNITSSSNHLAARHATLVLGYLENAKRK